MLRYLFKFIASVREVLCFSYCCSTVEVEQPTEEIELSSISRVRNHCNKASSI